MNGANSPVTLARRWLADLLQPVPPSGKAWCIRCPAAAGGGTLEMPAEQIYDHLRGHQERGEVVRVVMSQEARTGGDRP